MIVRTINLSFAAMCCLAALGTQAHGQTETPKQFDLICDQPMPAPPQRYVIDLDASQWCQPGYCEMAPKEVLTTTPDEIVLRDRRQGCMETFSGLCHVRLTVDRRSAVMTLSNEYPSTSGPIPDLPPTIVEKTTYQCKMAPFSGPSGKPQF